MGEADINDHANTDGTDQVAIDTKLLSSAIIELNISRKNITLYPVEHPLINKAVTRAYNILQDIFKFRRDISLGISKDTLIVEQSYLDKSNTVYRDFARAMNDKNIASVTFKDDLTIADLNGFLKTTSLNDEDLKSKGGLKAVLSDEGIAGISVTEIDYSSFEITDEDEISQNTPKTSDAAVNLWDSFVYNLMGDTLNTSQSAADKAYMDEVIRVDSKKLAEIINETTKKDAVQDARYDQLISDYLKEASNDELSEGERKKLIKEVAQFTNELTPDLRKQLLTSTFKDGSENLRGMEDFISDLSNETILDTLESVSEKQHKIPLTIMSLLEKFSQVGKEKKRFGAASEQMGTDDIFDLRGEVEELLVDDHQQDYTPDEYQAALTSFVQKGNADKFCTQYPIMYEMFKESFTDEFIDLRYALSLVEIAKVEQNTETFRMLVNRLGESGTFFTETGQYKSASVVWNFFFSVINSDEYPNDDKLIIFEKIDNFKELKIVDELIVGLRQWGKEKFEDIKTILLMFQDMAFKPLLKSLDLESNAYYRKLYMNILSEMDKRISSELVKYLDHEKWYFVRNIIVLLRNLKASEYLEEIRTCLAHENKVIRVEALKTLLELKGNVGLNIIKSCIEDKDEAFSHACILLAGSYQITELAPLLLGKLKKNTYFGSDFAEKKVLIKALGDMVDKGAIPVFKKLLKKNSIFKKSNNKELKILIFKCLRKYEEEDIKVLLDIGMSIKDEDIQAACRKINL